MRDFPLCGAKKGIKFHDRNADGDRDAGDEALANWQIKLYRDADGDKVLEDTDDGVTGNGATSIGTATTNANGEYEFPNLQNGDYIVCEVKQSRLEPVAAERRHAGQGRLQRRHRRWRPLGLGFKMAGPDHTGNDFGNYRNGTKSGIKFEDTNGNGVRNTGEPGARGCADPPVRHRRARQCRPPAPAHRCQRQLLDLGAARQLHGVRIGAGRLHAVVPDLGTELRRPHQCLRDRVLDHADLR